MNHPTLFALHGNESTTEQQLRPVGGAERLTGTAAKKDSVRGCTQKTPSYAAPTRKRKWRSGPESTRAV